MNLETVRVYANVPQEDSPWITPGKTNASVAVKELPGRSFTGLVTRSTLGALDPSTRSLLVGDRSSQNQDHALRPGTYAEGRRSDYGRSRTRWCCRLKRSAAVRRAGWSLSWNRARRSRCPFRYRYHRRDLD